MKEILKNYASFILIIVALVLIYFGLRPALAGLRTRSLELGVAQKEVEAKNQKVKTLTSFAEEIKKEAGLIAKVNTALPDESDWPSLLVMLESIVRESGVNLQNLQPGQAASNEAPLDVTVQGSFSGLKTFLANLEQNSRPLLVKSINIVADSTGNALNATLKIGAAYNGTAGAEKPAAPPVKALGGKEEQ